MHLIRDAPPSSELEAGFQPTLDQIDQDLVQPVRPTCVRCKSRCALVCELEKYSVLVLQVIRRVRMVKVRTRHRHCKGSKLPFYKASYSCGGTCCRPQLHARPSPRPSGTFDPGQEDNSIGPLLPPSILVILIRPLLRISDFASDEGRTFERMIPFHCTRDTR